MKHRSLLGILALSLGVILVPHLATGQQKPSESPTQKESSRPKAAKVYLGGVGTSPHIQNIMDDITDFLLEKKVGAAQMAGGKDESRHQLAARVKEAGGESLLFLSLDTGESQSDVSFRGIRLKAQCFAADGGKLWEDEVTNVVWGTMPTAVNGLIKKLRAKLDSRVAKAGLPVGQ